MNQADLDNYANQLNPDHEEYWHCREQPEHYPDSSDEDPEHGSEYGFSGRKYVAPKGPILHIIDSKSLRWGVEYDENVRCGYASNWPKDKPFVLPMDIHVYENSNTAAVEYGPPEEWFESYATIIQIWWQHVKRYRKKIIADKQMAFALQTLNEIRTKRTQISEAEALLQSLRLKTSQLESKFESNIRKVDTSSLRMPRPDGWFENRHNLFYQFTNKNSSLRGQRNYVAFGEELIKEWCVRRLVYKYDNRQMFGSLYCSQ